jgi:N-acetylglutamate synthase-like GNAT family acetyltransferase
MRERSLDVTIGPATAADVERILRALPEWFGIDSAVRDYVEDARSRPVLGATLDGRVIGVLVLHPTTDLATELHLLAVDPGFHGCGAGSALLAAAERELRRSGTRLLHVKTLGASHPSAHYARTRAFYERRGFLPMEERTDIWPGNPCLFMVKVL